MGFQDERETIHNTERKVGEVLFLYMVLHILVGFLIFMPLIMR